MAPLFYRIVVNSCDALPMTKGGSPSCRKDGIYVIDVPTFLDNGHTWQTAFESFTADLTNGGPPSQIMHCDFFNQPNSYSTSTGATTDVMFVSNGQFRSYVNLDSMGTLIGDLSIMRSKSLHSFLSALYTTPGNRPGAFAGALTLPTTSAVNYWTMVLLVFPVGKDSVNTL